MEWTERDIQIAKQLQEPEVKDFLRKIFTTIVTSHGSVLEKNIIALDDAEYGRLMKVHYLAKIENQEKINLITKISKMVKTPTTKKQLAPK